MTVLSTQITLPVECMATYW